MLGTFLSNLWTMTLIIGCLAVIVLLLTVMYATVTGLIAGIKHNKIKNETLKKIHNDFDKFIEDAQNQDKDDKEK